MATNLSKRTKPTAGTPAPVVAVPPGPPAQTVGLQRKVAELEAYVKTLERVLADPAKSLAAVTARAEAAEADWQAVTARLATVMAERDGCRAKDAARCAQIETLVHERDAAQQLYDTLLVARVAPEPESA